MARTLSGTLLFSLRVKGGETTCAITIDGSFDQDPGPLIDDFFNSIGHGRLWGRVRGRSARAR